MSESGRWQFWIDRGGTFTDIVARRPDGMLLTHKLLSENPEQYRDAAVAGIRQLLGIGAQAPITPQQVQCVKMGTTVATNALLERKGEPVLLVTTRGFRDALRIAYQNRPRLFDRCIVLPELLYSQVIEAQERVGADGAVLRPLDEAALRADLQQAFAAGLRAVAIVFLHGWRETAHETAAARIARNVGFTQISTSHQTSPLMKFVSRGDTTVVDAYLSPVLQRYVDQVAAEMPGVRLLFMQSSGGLTEAHAGGQPPGEQGDLGRPGLALRGKDAILSGPAGGIVGMARTAEQAGYAKVIGFDMGGTSTDVSHYAGSFERVFDVQVAGVRVRAPMLHIHTVAAGGSSILHFDGARLRVGPDSAGANPGPASYRRGGPLTITDANVMLGRIRPEHFPAVFGRSADQPLDAEVVRLRFAELAARIACDTGLPQSPEGVAEGYLAIAVQAMADAIKRISLARGYDVERYALQCFGGAGAQHACSVAEALGMERVFIHRLAGVLSAYGMGLAEQTAMQQRSVEAPLRAALLPRLHALREELAALATQELQAQEVAADTIRLQVQVLLRYDGSDAALPVALADAASMRAAFEHIYLQRYAHHMPERGLVVEALTVETAGGGEPVEREPLHTPTAGEMPRCAVLPVFIDRRWQDAALARRADCLPGQHLDGPALLTETHTTVFIAPGWRARITAAGHVELQRRAAQTRPRDDTTTVNPVRLELFNNQFMHIAEQMGVQLQNTAVSVNIKERLDFSCALFDPQGHLIANAPHVPVHLGSMGESIQTVIRENRHTMRPGDVFMLNDPYHGGTHLPDVTVVTPVFDAAGAQVLFHVGSRGHHADIGGITPGSMPPFSRRISEEGVVIDNFKLVEAGRLRETEVLALLSSGPWPARNPQQNLADLKAQIAANQTGVHELRRLVADYGLNVVQAYMGHVQDNAEAAVRRVIGALRDGAFTLELDTGARICVAIRVNHSTRSATIDFTGTSPQQPDNLNAPRAVTVAAVLYVFRCLVDDDIPLNAGCLKPLQLIVPEGSMLAPRPPAAVVAGNVEVSMCVTNALFGALGVQAASQCTMNNFTFGNARHQYYETIAGGSGAGGVFDAQGQQVGGFDGTSVVQNHMTNSRLTDPEVLEWRYPVRLESFAIRAGSGGAGRWHGGNGGVRRIRFLEPMTAGILSNGRRVPAFGLQGGAPGAVGINRVERADGRVETLPASASVELQAGDVFVIETPGGGGYG